MTYSTSNPPRLVSQDLGGEGGGLWNYRSTDDAATVNTNGYITDAKKLGMKTGDLVIVTDTDASPVATILMVVNAINADGSADLQDTTAATTDTD